MVVGIRAVVFDWRGTLVTTLSERAWVEEALRLVGRARAVEEVLAAIGRADGVPGRLGAVGVDCGARVHREVYFSVFADAGLDGEVAEALYAVESDPGYNVFAVDVAETLAAVVARGCRVAVLSDIHFDLRPVFAAAGLGGFVDVFVLSFERGVQKPDPAIFLAAVAELGVEPGAALMVGDRASHDGAAVEVGMPTLLVPPLVDPRVRRLGLVSGVVG